MNNKIAANIISIDNQIRVAEKSYGRPEHSIRLLAVSKNQSVNAIREACVAGQRCFGENYVQEAVDKIIELADESLEWHFIGAIQANKTRLIAEHFSWVQSVCRLDIAQRLNDQRPSHLPPLNICIQVNLGDEKQKQGIEMDAVSELVHSIYKLPALRLRGLMAIPPTVKTVEEQRFYFHSLYSVFKAMNKQGFELDTLSMGMSNDWQAAVAEGTTMIRIGTTIFGERHK